MAKVSGAAAPTIPGSDDIELPDVNAVNEEISRCMREEREEARANRRPGANLWVSLLKDAERKHPDDIFRQFVYCVRNGKLPAETGRKRESGEATRRKFGTDVTRALNDLRRERINLETLSALKRKHVVRLVQRYIRLDKSPSTINGRVTALRKLLSLVGRPREIPTGGAWKRLLRENGIDPQLLRRSQIRVIPKAVSARGLRPAEVIAMVDAKHFIVRLWLMLQWHFGLRPKECVELDPEESDRGDYLLVLHGTKNKRKRPVEFSKNPERRAAQRALLDEAKRLAKELNHHQGKLRDRHRNTVQALNHFYYITRKSGITEKELEIVPYSFRHEFANVEFEEVAGLPPPVLRKASHAEYVACAEKVNAAKKHVVNQLGHSALDKSNPYNGSEHELGRREKRQFAVLNLVSGNETLGTAVQRAGIQEVWLVGKAATGEKLAPGEPIGLAFRMPHVFSPMAMQELALAVQAMGRPVALSVCTERPDPALEVVFEHQRRPERTANPLPSR
jgi:integrase